MATDSSPPASLQPDPDSDELPPVTSPIPPSSKGKAPMEDEPDEFNCEDGDSYSQLRSCGICLSDEGHAVRGCIDSCNHYFCFLCIIEWSKIESRCPLCKGRFASIRRMRTDGTLIGDRPVIVPVRNQIYDPQGNSTSGPDLYANISCTICANSTDENLLLLCDLCDTAVHTYCAGLGATIPEGDWFCQECAQMKAEELNRSSAVPDHNTENPSPSVQAPILIFDIVREPGEPHPKVNRLLTVFSPQQQQSRQNAGGARGQGSGVCNKSEIKVTDSSVRTLHRCRDVHKYIRDLRENWNALRSGSMSFSTNNSRVNDTSRGHVSNGSLRGDMPYKGSRDVDRAWKMFDIAKSKQPQKVSGTSSSASGNLSVTVSSSKDSKTLFPGASSKIVPSKTKSNIITGLKAHQSFKKHDGCGSTGSGQHNNVITLGREKTTIYYAGPAAASPGKCTSSSNKNAQKPIKNDVFHGRAVMSSQQKLGQGLPHVYHEQGFGLSCSNLQRNPVSLNFEGRSVQTIDRDTKRTRESNQLQKSAEKRRNAEDIGSGSKRIKVDNEAKSEIQSLVKLNLKLLSAGKKLEVDVFKDIARRSTHEILAACGLEPPKHKKSPIPKPSCSHEDQIKKQSKLSLMPSSCRECFYAFVKEVVGSIMSDRILC